MNENALRDAHNLFVNTGYNGDINKFKNLIQTNPQALQDAHRLFVQTGYNGDINKFKNLILGNPKVIQQPAKPTAPVKEEKTEWGNLNYSISDESSRLQKMFYYEALKNECKRNLWISIPLLLILFYLSINFLKKIFFNRENRINLLSLKDFFYSIDSNILQVENVHKRLIQLVSILLIYVAFKRNYFQYPILIYSHIFIFCIIWIIYYLIKFIDNILLLYIVKYERQILFVIIINFVHSLYSHFYGNTSLVYLYIFTVLPFILYSIIFLFNQKTDLNLPLLNYVKMLNPRVNFYIQQNIYISYFIGFNLFYGSLSYSYTIYSIVFIWFVLFLYIKLLYNSNEITKQNNFISTDYIDLNQRKKSIIKLLLIFAIISFILIYFNL